MAEIPIGLNVLGSVTGMAVNVSPIPELLKATKTRQLEGVSHSFLACTNFNAVLWLLYSVKADYKYIFFPNMINFGATLALLIWFNLLNRSLWKFLALYVPVLALTSLFHLQVVPEDLVGLVAVLVNFFYFLAPLGQLEPVFLEKQCEHIDLYVLLSCFVNGLFWSMIGIITNNYYMIVPNLGGLLVSVFQFSVYFWALGTLPHEVFSGLQTITRGLSAVARPLKTNK